MTATISTPFNDAQLLLLRLFSRPMPEKTFNELRELLINFYEMMLQNEVERVMDEKKVDRTDFDKILNEHQRTK